MLDTKVKERTKQDKVFLDAANATFNSSTELSGNFIFIDGKRLLRKNEINEIITCLVRKKGYQPDMSLRLQCYFSGSTLDYGNFRKILKLQRTLLKHKKIVYK